MKKLKHITVLLLVLLSVNLLAQNEGPGHPILDDFKVIEISGKVYIDVTISSGNTCNGITVWRSVDSLNFEQVGDVAGICGNASTPVSYSFIDENPIKNKTIYYKVELGGSGFTIPRSILIIDTQEFGFQIRPNPANEKAVIYFENPQSQEVELVLYDLAGNKMLELKSETNAFTIRTLELNKGLYFFSIGKTSSQNRTKGKIMVVH